MAEVIFARQFLSNLDARPVKLSPDHVEDPKNFPARPPVSEQSSLVQYSINVPA